MANTFDPTRTPSGWVLSLGDKKVEKTSSGTSSAWQAVLAYRGGGSNIYFEAKISRSSSGNYQGSVGLIPEGRLGDFDSGVRLQNAGFAYAGGGGLFSLGASIFLPTSYGNGDTIMIAVRGSDGGFFTGKNGTWDRNPATQAPRGFLPFVGVGRWYVAVECRNQDNAVEIVTATADFAYTVPSGYADLDSLIVSPAPEELFATQVSGEAIQTGTGELRATQVSGEVIQMGSGELRATQVSLEVISIAEEAPQEPLAVTHASIEAIQTGSGELRATQVSVEVIQFPDGPLRATHISAEALSPDLAGFPPQIDAVVSGDLVTLLSSPYTGVNQTHESTQWQVTLNADTGFTSPVLDVTSTEDLLSLIVSSLEYETTYRARLRHNGSSSSTLFSAPVVFTTADDPAIRPNAPVLTLLPGFVANGANIGTTPFTHPDGQVDPPDFDPEDPKPYAANFEWSLIALGGDFNSPLLGPNSEFLAWQQLQFVASDPLLVPGSTYQVRARWLDGLSLAWSPYSNILTFTVADPGPVPAFDPVITKEDNWVCVAPGASECDLWYTVRRLGSTGAEVTIADGRCFQATDPCEKVSIRMWPICGPVWQQVPPPVFEQIDTPPHPNQLFFRTNQEDVLSKVPGDLVEGVFRVYFDIDAGDTYTASMSSNDGVTFGALPAGSSLAAGYVEVDPTALAEGWHILKLVPQTNDPFCGEGSGFPCYFPFRKGGLPAVVHVLDFKSMESAPNSEPLWDSVPLIEWGFRPGAGVYVRSAPEGWSDFTRVNIWSGLTFPEIGTPTIYEGVLTFTIDPRESEDMSYFDRFQVASFLKPSVAVLAEGEGDIRSNEDLRQWRGAALMSVPGYGHWPLGGRNPRDGESLQSRQVAANTIGNGTFFAQQRPELFKYGSTAIPRNRALISLKRTLDFGFGYFPGALDKPYQGRHSVKNYSFGRAMYTMRFKVELREEEVVFSLLQAGPELEEIGWTFFEEVIARFGAGGAFHDQGRVGVAIAASSLLRGSRLESRVEAQFHSLVVHVYDDQPVPPPPPPPIKVPCILERYLFFGTSGSDELELYQDIHTDPGDEPITSVALTREIAPFGVGGEALFTNVYFTLTAWTTGTVVITPVVNGEEKVAARRTVSFESDGSTEFTKRYEIALYELIEDDEIQVGRHGLRGTFFQLKVELEDTLGAGRVSLGGFELETEPVVNISQDQVYSPQPSVPTTVPIAGRSLFFGSSGTDELRVYREINMDVDEDVPLLARSRQAAPLGPGGEAIFTRLHMPIYRDNADMVLVSIVPIVNGERYPELTLELDGVETPIREVRHLDLYEPIMDGLTEVGRQAIRGTWWGVEIKVEDGVMVGGLRFGGIELEFEPVTESEVEQ